LYRRRPNNRRKNILPGESGNISSKELDPETGFYYYGARYLDPRTSRWLSGDPALGEYLSAALVDEEARKRNGNLPGQGGVFNLVNLHVYHYAGNNPVKYVDPNGENIFTNIKNYFDKKNEERKARKIQEANEFNDFMGFLDEQGVRRDDPMSAFKYEKIAEKWENLPKSVRNFNPKEFWAKLVARLGLHFGWQLRLPGGYHIAEEHGGVYVHHDVNDPLEGPNETKEHNKTEVPKAPRENPADKIKPNWEERENK
jgi:hypothetical protein